MPLLSPAAPSGAAVPIDPIRRFTLPALSCESLIVLASAWFALCCNGPFWRGLLHGRGWADAGTWRYAACALAAMVALQALLLAPLVGRRTARPMLAVLLLVAAVTDHFVRRYALALDAGMVRNVLQTDLPEARELLSPALAVDLLLRGVLPALLLWRVPLRIRPLRQALAVRLLFVLAAGAIAALAILGAFQDLSAAMRNDKALRYRLTPANAAFALARATATGPAESAARLPVGTDATVVAPRATRPRLLVLVVGETARAANWGLNGYARQTTPELAAAGVLNFPFVTACGSSTEVSLPCMFAPVGRRDYDERRIRTQESLLHVLARAGIAVRWRDNQSGCKGVCAGLPYERMDGVPGLCAHGRCLDEVLLHELERAAVPGRDTLLVLHQLGNHGPAYSARHPAAFRHFTPACDTPDLGQCSREQIVNSYDNALRYTDHVLARLIGRLRALASHDTALLYVSDHGESLGEKGLYLHGMPYAIAPREQLHVPMVLWLSDDFRAGAGLDGACLARRAREKLSHDHLFHSVLGLLSVRTAAREPALDIVSPCRIGRDN